MFGIFLQLIGLGAALTAAAVGLAVSRWAQRRAVPIAFVTAAVLLAFQQGLSAYATFSGAVAMGAAGPLLGMVASALLLWAVLGFRGSSLLQQAPTGAVDKSTQDILFALPEAVTICSLEGRIKSANPCAARLHGFDSPHALLASGKTFQDFVIPEEREKLAHSTERLLEEAKPRYSSYTGVRHDGERYPVEISRSLLRDESGKPSEIVIVARDVSAKHKAQAALRQERDFNRTLIQASPVYFVALDKRGRLLMINDYMLDTLGYARDELVGCDYLAACVPEREREALGEVFSQLIKQDSPTFNENHVLAKDGQERLVEWHGRSVRDKNGELTYFFGVGIDITERRRLEESEQAHSELLEELNAELRQSNRELDEFTRMASHDLQEPTRKQLMFVQVLRDTVGNQCSQEAEYALQAVENAAKRMQTLVEDLLALSRSGRQLLHPEEFDLDDSVDAALKILSDQIECSGAEVQRDPLPVVYGDRTILTQLFQNLISNALKFQDTAPPVIRITKESLDGRWVLGVADNGIGIALEDIEKVFSAFKRVHSRSEFEGSGIGLAICRRIVDRHDGALWVESEPGHGAHFKFTLGWRPKSLATRDAARSNADADAGSGSEETVD